jgi:hypothetical protein
MCRAGPASDLVRLRCPALGIVGNRTRTGVRLMERAMGAVHGSRLEVVRDSFDPPSVCQPAEFNRLLMEFLHEIGW